MARQLTQLLLVASCCSITYGFNPVASRVRLDLNFEHASLPSTDESPVGVCVNEKLADLPPVLQSIADERREFQMNLGKAMDTLRKDMPYILKETPGMWSNTTDV
jgi:hypothetical protein